MLHIGLTGGIAAGKSAAAGVLEELGAARIDADVIAREVVAPATPGLRAVVQEFGEQVLDADGALDRAALGRLVFTDDDARAQLNAIVHPLVGRRTVDLVAALPGDAIVVHDVPLIVENNLASQYHLVLVAGASAQVRLDRLVEGRGMSEVDAWARIRAQASDAERRRVADVWLDTESPQGQTRTAIETLWEHRLVPYARNIAASRVAARVGPARLLEPPPPPRTWSVQAEQILARLRRAGGETVRSADHIGSTAVPGLIAKDVLDLQLGVDSLTAADQIADALRAAGFPVRTDIDSDTPNPGEPDPARWAKRYHGNADPGRAVNLHIREVDGPGWHYALAFRDWLRAEASVRAEYAEVKQRIAGATASTGEYAQAKETWFTKAWPRLQAWVEQTEWTAPTH